MSKYFVTPPSLMAQVLFVCQLPDVPSPYQIVLMHCRSVGYNRDKRPHKLAGSCGAIARAHDSRERVWNQGWSKVPIDSVTAVAWQRHVVRLREHLRGPVQACSLGATSSWAALS